MDDDFVLSGAAGSGPDVDGPEDDELEFRVSVAPTGWTEQDTGLLEAALDLAGITDQAERLKAALAVDVMGIVILGPLVAMIEDGRAQIRAYFEHIQGGIGK